MRSTAFHVHKLVLCHHSSYFRTYIEPLTAGRRAYPANERSDHPDTPHCIRLPSKCGKREASEDDFRLFLCHLYFARHYCCIPYEVATDIDLAAVPAPAVSFDCPTFSTWQQLDDASSSDFFSRPGAAQYSALLSLCHYFDCAELLSRAEDNMLLVVAADDDESVSQIRVSQQLLGDADSLGNGDTLRPATSEASVYSRASEAPSSHLQAY